MSPAPFQRKLKCKFTMFDIMLVVAEISFHVFQDVCGNSSYNL